MKRVLACFIITALFISTVLVSAACAGWKENYREKYSKKQLQPNSEKARRLRTLANFEFKYKKDWGKKSTTAKKVPRKDKFAGASQNFTASNTGSRQPKKAEKTGHTLTGAIQSAGKVLSLEPSGRESESIK